MQNFDHNIGFWEKNANFFAENCQKSQKIVFITSTPDEFVKKSSNTWPNPFLVKMYVCIHNLCRGQKWPNNLGCLGVIFRKLPKVNNHPKFENSPYLVTLLWLTRIGIWSKLKENANIWLRCWGSRCGNKWKIKRSRVRSTASSRQH
jgi:hypothetical protein